MMYILCNRATKKIEGGSRWDEFDFNPVTHVQIIADRFPDKEREKLNDTEDGFIPMTAEELSIAAPAVPQIQRFRATTYSPKHLFIAWTIIPSFTWTFTVSERSLFKARGYIDTEHRGVYISNSAVMIAGHLKLNGVTIEGSVVGGNIYNRTDHYLTVPIFGDIEVDPGTHTVEFYLRSASDAAPGVDGIAQVTPDGGYNCAVYEAIPLSMMGIV